MALNTEALRTLLCQRLCEDVRVQERPDGALMLHTNFQFATQSISASLPQAGCGCLTVATRSCTSATNTT